MEKQYGILSFREDLPGLFEPMEGACDGYARINRDDYSGGILAVFRQGAAERSVLMRVADLPASDRFVICDMEGNTVAEMRGDQLSREGMRVTFDALYDGKLFELRRV